MNPGEKSSGFFYFQPVKKLLFLFIPFLLFTCRDTQDADLGPNILIGTGSSQSYYVENDTIAFQINLSAIEGLRSLSVDHVTRNLDLLQLTGTVIENETTLGLLYFYVVDTSEQTGDTALISFEVRDVKDQFSSALFEYKVAEPIDTATRIFGDQLNPNFGNCISLIEQRIYTLDEAGQDASTIDLVLYRDSVLNWTLISPIDLVNDSLVPEMSSFNLRRNTRFTGGLFDGADFNNLVNDGPLVAEDSIPQLTYLDSINGARVLYFITPENRQGLLRLSNFADTVGNFGTVEIKIQR